MIFYFRKRKNHCANSKIYILFMEMLPELRRHLKWFRSWNFDLENQEHYDRLVVVDDDQIERQIKNNPGHTTQDIVEIFYISHRSVVRNLTILGYVNLYNVWMVRDLTEKKTNKLMNRISICDQVNKTVYFIKESSQAMQNATCTTIWSE